MQRNLTAVKKPIQQIVNSAKITRSEMMKIRENFMLYSNLKQICFISELQY